MSEEDVVLGPAKEVRDDQEKVEVREREPEPERQEQVVSPRRRFLASLSVERLISLFNDESASPPWNEEVRAEILEFILEKGGPGAVRKALGRSMAVGDRHGIRTRATPGGEEPGGGRAAEPGPGEVFLAALARAMWQRDLAPGETEPWVADLAIVCERGAVPLTQYLDAAAAALGVEPGPWTDAVCWFQGPRLPLAPMASLSAMARDLSGILAALAGRGGGWSLSVRVELGDGSRVILEPEDGLGLETWLTRWVGDGPGRWVARVLDGRIRGPLPWVTLGAEGPSLGRGDLWFGDRDGDGRPDVAPGPGSFPLNLTTIWWLATVARGLGYGLHPIHRPRAGLWLGPGLFGVEELGRVTICGLRHTGELATAVSRWGDELTRDLAGRFPDGPWSFPGERRDEVCHALGLGAI